MKYYLSAITGKVITEKDLKVFDIIYGDISKENRWLAGVPWNALDEYIDPPSIVEMLKRDSWATAVTRYMELYPDVEYNRACRAVAIMKKDISRFKNKEE